MSQMLGLRPRAKEQTVSETAGDSDVARVFFDTFSRRVSQVETSVGQLSSEVEKVKSLLDRGQISDLVLLDRLKRSEDFLREYIGSIKSSLERMASVEESRMGQSVPQEVSPSVNRSVEPVIQAPVLATVRIPASVGEIGSLPSITTATELQVLTLLANEGPKSAPEIGRVVGRSREHTARLMKKLFEEGYIRRDQTRIPFRYSLVERVKQAFEKASAKDEGKEAISVPQT